MRVVVENEKKERLELSGNYAMTSIAGLTPCNAVVNMSGSALLDGENYNSSYISRRNIVITVVPLNDIEKSRIELYNFFKTKHKVRLYITTKLRDVYIDGIVEAMEGDLNAMKQRFQISILCPDPYFTDSKTNETVQEVAISSFEFEAELPSAGVELSKIGGNIETAIINNGEDNGLDIEIIANGSVSGIKIYNRTTAQQFGLDFPLEQGDKVSICTKKRKKSVYLNRSGGYVNLINYVAVDSDWLELVQGSNSLTYSCAVGADKITIIYKTGDIYVGV